MLSKSGKSILYKESNICCFWQNLLSIAEMFAIFTQIISAALINSNYLGAARIQVQCLYVALSGNIFVITAWNKRTHVKKSGYSTYGLKEECFINYIWF